MILLSLLLLATLIDLGVVYVYGWAQLIVSSDVESLILLLPPVLVACWSSCSAALPLSSLTMPSFLLCAMLIVRWSSCVDGFTTLLRLLVGLANRWAAESSPPPAVLCWPVSQICVPFLLCSYLIELRFFPGVSSALCGLPFSLCRNFIGLRNFFSFPSVFLV
jgi:hypothetical protein